jgi:hypothetical protein
LKELPEWLKRAQAIISAMDAADRVAAQYKWLKALEFIKWQGKCPSAGQIMQTRAHIGKSRNSLNLFFLGDGVTINQNFGQRDHFIHFRYILDWIKYGQNWVSPEESQPDIRLRTVCEARRERLRWWTQNIKDLGFVPTPGITHPRVISDLIVSKVYSVWIRHSQKWIGVSVSFSWRQNWKRKGQALDQHQEHEAPAVRSAILKED